MSFQIMGVSVECDVAQGLQGWQKYKCKPEDFLCAFSMGGGGDLTYLLDVKLYIQIYHSILFHYFWFALSWLHFDDGIMTKPWQNNVEIVTESCRYHETMIAKQM